MNATSHDSTRHPRTAAPRPLAVDDYVRGFWPGTGRCSPRTITLVESNSRMHEAQAQEVLQRLLPHYGKAKRVGITGVPGVGKSTFIESFGCLPGGTRDKLAC